MFWKSVNTPTDVSASARGRAFELLYKLLQKADVVEIHWHLSGDRLMTIAYGELQTLAPLSCECARLRDINCSRCSKPERRIFKASDVRSHVCRERLASVHARSKCTSCMDVLTLTYRFCVHRTSNIWCAMHMCAFCMQYFTRFFVFPWSVHALACCKCFRTYLYLWFVARLCIEEALISPIKRVECQRIVH